MAAFSRVVLRLYVTIALVSSPAFRIA